MQTRYLADIADVITGTSPDRGVPQEAVSFIQIKDLDPAKRSLVIGERPSEKRAIPSRPGDILLAARGGQAVIVGQGAGRGLVGAYPTLDVYLIRPNAERLDAGYLAAWLALEPVRNGLQASTTGALIPRIPIVSLKGLSIPLPSLARQRAIGELFHLAREETVLLERLVASTRHLRERQLAAAFASLESATA